MTVEEDLRPAADRVPSVVLGTRPEVIKLSEIVRLLEPRVRVIHTGQHFSSELADSFSQELGLPDPDAQLGVGGKSRGIQIGQALVQLERWLDDQLTDLVIVQGDTNAALAGALAANAKGISLVHVEAGLRSHDRRMPEEHNRVLIDHIADVCLAPTETSRLNLLNEGIPDDRIQVTGNTVVEAVQRLLPTRDERISRIEDLGLTSRRYVLATFHRPENVDRAHTLKTILNELAELPTPVVLPLHPRTARRAAEFDLADLLKRVTVIPPVDYKSFLTLAAECAYMVSDSGGVQEEASILKRPVLVVRNSTERPEVLGTFSHLIQPGEDIRMVGREWWDEIDAIHRRLQDIPSPYGDGSASQLCVDIVNGMRKHPGATRNGSDSSNARSM